MQDSVGPESFDGLVEGQAAIEAEPLARVAMPLNVEAVGADPIEASERRIELFAGIVREAGSIALYEAIFGAMPFAENVDRIVELGRLDRRQEARLQEVIDQPFARGGNASLFGLGECGVRFKRLAQG